MSTGQTMVHTNQDTENRLRDWLMPPAWKGRLFDLHYRWTHSERSRLLARNAELRGKHVERQRCFVIGNGPSLKNQDIRPLRNEVTIVANSFFRHPDRDTVRPGYCCVADDRHLSGEPNSIAWLRELESGLPDTVMCFLHAGRPVFESHGLFRKHQVYYFDTGIMARTVAEVRFDFTKPTNVGFSTGSVFAIPLAIYLGCREIYLLGFDANWVADLTGPLHFYEHNPHFPQFDTTLGEGVLLEEQLRNSYLEFKSHRMLRQKAESMGVRIFNATGGGLLDMYPRVSYESVIARSA